MTGGTPKTKGFLDKMNWFGVGLKSAFFSILSNSKSIVLLKEYGADAKRRRITGHATIYDGLLDFDGPELFVTTPFFFAMKSDIIRTVIIEMIINIPIRRAVPSFVVGSTHHTAISPSRNPAPPLTPNFIRASSTVVHLLGTKHC
jgi:hypothetical protein